MNQDEVLPKAIWSGSFFLGGVEMICHVLDNGMRIIDADSVNDFFQALIEGTMCPTEEETINFGKWIRGVEE